MPIVARPLGPDFWGKSSTEGHVTTGTPSPPWALLPWVVLPDAFQRRRHRGALALDALHFCRPFRGMTALDGRRRPAAILKLLR